MQTIPSTLRPKFLWKNLLLGAAACGLATSGSHAAVYYLKAGSGGTNWGVASDWNSQIDGSGTNAPAMAGNDFVVTAGRTVGSPSGAATFSGASLTLNGGGLNLRNGGVKTVSPLTIVGSSTIGANNGGTTLSASVFSATTGSVTTFVDQQGVSGVASVQTLTFGTLSGAGDLLLSAAAGVNPGGSKTFSLSATTATSFTGNIQWIGSNAISLDFGNDLVSGGGLIATNSISRITLDQNVTFAAVSLNGVFLTPDNYTFAELEAIAPTIFNDGGSGSITVVPEPATAMCLLGGFGVMLLARRRTGSRNLQE